METYTANCLPRNWSFNDQGKHIERKYNTQLSNFKMSTANLLEALSLCSPNSDKLDLDAMECSYDDLLHIYCLDELEMQVFPLHTVEIAYDCNQLIECAEIAEIIEVAEFKLNPLEFKIFQLSLDGYLLHEIADMLKVSLKTAIVSRIHTTEVLRYNLQ